MAKTWVCADHHFGHRNIVKFLREDGSKLRPFETIEEHDEEIIRRHNDVVGDDDRVYFLGDFGNPSVVHRLKGRPVLVKGNHDDLKLSKYNGFQDIRGYVVKKGYILSHIPIHPGSMGRWQVNIHGHLHSEVVLQEHSVVQGSNPTSFSTEIPDPRYVCVSLEHTDYYPVDLQKLIDKFVKT